MPSGLSNVVAVAGGAAHTLALRSDGVVVAWGDNSYGQRSVPTGLKRVVSISSAYSYSVALQEDRTVVIWGDMSSPPSGLTNVIAITAVGRVLGLVAPPAERPPFSEVTYRPGQGLQASLAVEQGRTYLLEASTNLMDWTYVRPFTATSSVLGITDPLATNYSGRFYRAVTPGTSPP